MVIVKIIIVTDGPVPQATQVGSFSVTPDTLDNLAIPALRQIVSDHHAANELAINAGSRR